MLFIFLFLSICIHYMFRPLWAILGCNIKLVNHWKLRGIMPTTDPLFLLGYTIIIYFFVLCFGESAVVYFLLGYEMCLWYGYKLCYIVTVL
jgi:hypothetical protein